MALKALSHFKHIVYFVFLIGFTNCETQNMEERHPDSIGIQGDNRYCLYCASELSVTGDGIALTKDWAKAFDAKIHFVHVDSSDSSDKMPDIAEFMKDSNINYAVKDLDFVTVRGQMWLNA